MDPVVPSPQKHDWGMSWGFSGPSQEGPLDPV
jgi:hypothetical protein